MAEERRGGWTLDTLRIHLLSRIDALKVYHDQSVESQVRALKAALRASEKAIDKAESQTIRRLDQMTSAYQEAHAALVKRVDDLAIRAERSEGKGIGLNAGWVYLLGGITGIGAIVSIVILITGR